MPQISQIGEIYASQLFWLAIVIRVIYFGIGTAMSPKIEATIEDRNGRIAGDIAAAEAARAGLRSRPSAIIKRGSNPRVPRRPSPSAKPRRGRLPAPRPS